MSDRRVDSQNLRDIEHDLNSHSVKTGSSKHNKSDSTLESGVDTGVENKFPGAQVMYGSEATGRKIPPQEGGEVKRSGRMTTDRDFEGPGGPEEKAERLRRDRGGDDGV
ncbi:hypothetical protein K440DRAFT_618181 [Wilcoxina mikolae CBS 423.85]|nr:hypothetical protein K440DRAFT_618181 [Wilcoxina mikolae CBS 423.85]